MVHTVFHRCLTTVYALVSCRRSIVRVEQYLYSCKSQTILYELFQTAALGKSAPERDCPAGQHSGYRIRWSAAVCTDARLLPYDSADKIAAAKEYFA